MRRTTQNPRATARPAPPARISAEQLGLLSHEFRTPLNGVLGMARLLESTKLTAEQRSYVTALRESGEHLLGLVNDVLDFARLGAGKVELHRQPVEVEALLRSVCELLSPRAQEKGLEIAWAAPAGAGRILADEGRIRQILLNFAGNAIKFTPEGGALISVEEMPNGRLRFTVADTGPGVAEVAREKVFEAFAQADSIHDAELGGAGLGLAIARRLALSMQGEVGIDTAGTGGAAFWFEAGFERPAAAILPTPLSGRTVGVASPNTIVREAARAQIEACGARAVVTTSLASLLARTKAGDVVLIDHAFAGEGETLTPPADRPAIILLAPEGREQIDPCRQAGFAGYLIKPLRRASLAERVLAAAGGEAATAGPVPEDERIAEATAPGARVLLVEDNPINAMLANVLLTREGCTVEHARVGEEAIAAVQVGAFDLILMDMRMPGLSGVEATRRLRADGVTTPVVALTANAFEDDRQECLAAGMDDFLVKPLSHDALRAILARWARGGWTETPARAKVG